MDCSTSGFPVLHYLTEFAQTNVHWVGDGIQPSHPLSLPSPPALNLSQHQDLFWWVISSHQVAKVLEFQHQSFNEYSGLISFRIDWFDTLVVQGTLKILLQCHNSLVLFFSAINSLVLCLLCGPTYIHTWLLENPWLWLYSKVMSLLFNTLSRFVIAFLPRGKCLLIS